MENFKKQPHIAGDFSSRISYELKQAERYRIFVSLLVFNFQPVLEKVADRNLKSQEDKDSFLQAVKSVIRGSVREVDSVSNSSLVKVGILCPETSRQGAEAAARRLQDSLSHFCADFFGNGNDFLIPVEISSFPDAAGARSLASYSDEFTPTN